MKRNRHMSNILDVFSLFLIDYKLSFTGREVARALKISPQTALNNLNILTKEKAILTKREGRNKKYTLNLEKLNTKLYLQMAETNLARSFLKNFELKSVVETLLPFVETLIVFGSFAKGKEKDHSDIDLMAIGTKSKDRIRKEKKVFAREINLHYVTWHEFSKSLKEKEPLALEIKKTHLIYGNVFKAVKVYCDN